MKKTFLIIISVANFNANSAILHGKVIGVSDGDTIKILSQSNQQFKIRLEGIDAPEKKQAYGVLSKQNLSDCAYLKYVFVESNKIDRYGRLIGKVISNGVDCNLRQIELGFAWHYKKYQSEQSLSDREKYSFAESNARKNKRGLWSEPNPIPPWDFRKHKNKKA